MLKMCQQKKYYVYVGYADLQVSDNTVIMADLENHSLRHSAKYTDEASIYASLKSQMYIPHQVNN